MEVDFAGGAYETFSKTLNAQECVNLFVHIDQNDAVAVKSLRGTPGLKVWATGLPCAEVRGLQVMRDNLFAVVGNTVYLVDARGSGTAASTLLTTLKGPVSMANNGTQIVLVDGENGYVVTFSGSTPTVTTISDEAFPTGAQTVTFQDGYFLVTYSGSGRVYISDLNQGTSWNDTMYFNAESSPDNSLNAVSDRRELVVFGSSSIEAWYNSGETVPFNRKPGFGQEIGLGARHSVAQVDNSLLFLTDRGQIARMAGGGIKALSTRGIEHRIAQYERTDDARGMVSYIEGNAFYILTFPSAGVTWCVNMATGVFNQLASFPEPFTGRWRGNCTASYGGYTVVGDYENGQIYQLDFATYTDNAQPIKRVRTSPAVRKEGKRVVFHQLELFFEPGVGLDGTAQGDTPKVMLQYSDDGGFTWSNEIWREVGTLGDYKNRAVWLRLGSARQRNFRFMVSDPVKWVLTGANLEVDLGAA